MLELIKAVVHRDYHEDTEGDLLEMHEENVRKFGIQKSNRLFLTETVTLVCHALVDHFLSDKNDMKKKDMLVITVISLVLLTFIALPYLQGTFLMATVVLSAICQLIGFMGIVFIPIGIVGIAVNKIKKSKIDPSNQNRSNYYTAVFALVTGTLLYAGLNIALFINGDLKAAILTLVTGIYLGYKAFSYLQAHRQAIVFPRLFAYLVFIPLVAFLGRKVLASELSNISRDKTINQAAILVDEIEDYKRSTGKYPNSIDDIPVALPQPKFMGIESFKYERRDDTYNLFFVQWVDMGAVQEVVVYSNTGNYNMKGHFASFDASQPRWRYFWLD